jgi:hypothetical protein
MQTLFMKLIAAADFSDVFLNAREHRATRGHSQVRKLDARLREKMMSNFASTGVVPLEPRSEIVRPRAK